MLKILIVDDEPPARARLRRLLGPLPGCGVVGEAGSGQEALAQIQRLAPDLLLLDISMPGLDGMALARTLRGQERVPAVVFCTAWPDQALEAFDTDAVDYLVKPVRVERLRQALEKARRFRAPEPADPAAMPRLRSRVGSRTLLVELDQVICALAEHKYTTVIHTGGRCVINEPLIDLERAYPQYLVRIHRNALVAPKFIRGLEGRTRGATLLLLEGTNVRPEVSRRKLAEVRKIIREWS